MQHLEGLNDAQREAVLATEGPISVLAGAGSGKTRVLTTRIQHLIKNGVPAERILAVTFTNKAAREMRERLAARLGDIPLPFVATFHGLGRDILERYGTRIGVPRYFTIFDRDDSKSAVRQVLKEMDIDPKELNPNTVLSRISKEKGEGRTPEQFRETDGRKSFQMRVISEVWPRYESIIRKEKALDFDDLIALPMRLLRDHEDIRAEAQSLYSHIHVDEFQDTNTLQGKITEYLSEKHRNLFVVGDIDQTIYTWRGATIDNLLDFERVYPEAKTIVLAHNYRSTKTIVTAGNQIIEKNKNRKDKHAVTDNADGEPIQLYIAQNADREARFVAKEAAKAIQQGIAPEEIAVLFRTNFQSRAIEEAFLSEGVPYRVLGTRFLDRKEVKDVLAWIRLALDPEREADRMRAVQAPTRGIGKVTLAKLAAGQKDSLRPADRAKVDVFEAIVNELHEATKSTKPSDFVRLVIERTGLDAALAKEGEDGQERLENVKELATLASRFDGEPGEAGLAGFLAESALAGDQDEMDAPGKKGVSGVTLMTVHAAKGLEFDTVFITGMEEGLFPHQGHEGEKRDEEEERRLFYVAVTRAKRRLFLTMAYIRRIYGTDFASEPSSFIGDIDEGLITVTHDGRDFYTERTIYL